MRMKTPGKRAHVLNEQDPSWFIDIPDFQVIGIAHRIVDAFDAEETAVVAPGRIIRHQIRAGRKRRQQPVVRDRANLHRAAAAANREAVERRIQTS